MAATPPSHLPTGRAPPGGEQRPPVEQVHESLAALSDANESTIRSPAEASIGDAEVGALDASRENPHFQRSSGGRDLGYTDEALARLIESPLDPGCPQAGEALTRRQPDRAAGGDDAPRTSPGDLRTTTGEGQLHRPRPELSVSIDGAGSDVFSIHHSGVAVLNESSAASPERLTYRKSPLDVTADGRLNSPIKSPVKSPSNRRGDGRIPPGHDTKDLLKFIDLDRDAFISAVHEPLIGADVVHGVNLGLNRQSVKALREDGPLQKLARLKDEIADFNALFSKQKARKDKIKAVGKKKYLHIDKVKLVQLDRKFMYEIHHEFDLYESMRLGRFVPNTPEKASEIEETQRKIEQKEAEELREKMTAVVIMVQKVFRGRRVRAEAMRKRAEAAAAEAARIAAEREAARLAAASFRPPAAKLPTPPTNENDPTQSPWDLFCIWSATDPVQGEASSDSLASNKSKKGGDKSKKPIDLKKERTMDYKEWTAMLTHLGLMSDPKKKKPRVSRQKSSELFKQANRSGASSDGDNGELDWDEFEFAFRRLAEHLGVHPTEVWCCMHQGFKPLQVDYGPMTDGLRDLFMLYAAGDPGKGAKGAQIGKRAASMDGREFTALLEHLKLVGDEKLGVSKTFAMDSFARAKAKHNNGKDTGEMDLGGFEWAMRRICRQVGANFQTLHIRPPSPQTASSKTSKEKLTSAVKKTVAVAKMVNAVQVMDGTQA